MPEQNNNATGARPRPKVLLNEVQYQDLFFYQKSEVLYAMTYHFCKRFLPEHGDRTVDQMVQAARSGKQNIIEGLADGMTSTEMQLKLLNVARSSLKELRADYEDYVTLPSGMPHTPATTPCCASVASTTRRATTSLTSSAGTTRNCAMWL